METSTLLQMHCVTNAKINIHDIDLCDEVRFRRGIDVIMHELRSATLFQYAFLAQKHYSMHFLRKSITVCISCAEALQYAFLAQKQHSI